jgi:maleamate amidohydrolase
MSVSEPIAYTPPAGLAAMVELAQMEPAALLAQTRSALLLVDVQNRFLYEDSVDRPASTARVLDPIGRLLGVARANDVPRFYVTVGHAADGASDAAPWLRRLAGMGSDVTARLRQPLTDWHSAVPDAIAPQPGEIWLRKWRFSAFYETGLEVLLRGAGIETVVIGGVASYGCIIATYIDACCRGFFPLVAVEATAGADPALHAAAMEFMGRHSQITAAQVLEVWRK